MQPLPGLQKNIQRNWAAKPHNWSKLFWAALGESTAHVSSLLNLSSNENTMFWNFNKSPQTSGTIVCPQKGESSQTPLLVLIMLSFKSHIHLVSFLLSRPLERSVQILMWKVNLFRITLILLFKYLANI